MIGPFRIGVLEPVAVGVSVPLGVEEVVGEGPGVYVADGVNVLLGVGVMLGVKVMLGVGDGPGVAELVAVGGTGVLDGVSVLVEVGVLLGVGVAVGGAMTSNMPLLTKYGTAWTSGSPIATSVRVNADGPGAALPSTRNTTTASEPSGINFGEVGVGVGVGVGGSGTGVGGKSKMRTLTTPAAGYDIYMVLSAESAAEPITTLVTASRLSSKFRSKLAIET